MNSQTLDCKKDLLNCILARRREQWERTQIAKLSMLGKAPKNDSWKTKYEIPLSCDQVQLPPLPGGWTWATIDQIAELVTKGSSPNWQGFQYCQHGIVFVRSQNVDWGSLNLSDIAHLPPSFNDREKKSVLRKGDVLLNIVGGSIGRVAIASEELDGGNVNQAVAVIRLVPNGVLNAFLVLYLLSPDAQKRIHAEKVDVARANISLEDIRALPIPLSPLDEQYRIVTEIEKQFTRLDAGVASLKRVQAALKRYRASVLKAACEGRLVPTEAELARKEGRSYEPAADLLVRILKERRSLWESNELAKLNASGKTLVSDTWKAKYREPLQAERSDTKSLPEGWTWAAADQWATTITDGEHITPQRTANGVLLLSARNILDGKISLDEVDYVPESEYRRIAKRLTVNAGDVLLSCSGTVGRSCVAPAGLKFALVRSVAVLKPLMKMGAYLSIALRSPELQEQINTKKTQTAQANIFQGKIKVLTFPIPPLLEQHRIVAEVERRFSVIKEVEAAVESNLKRAERLRQSILHGAFSGQVRSTVQY